MPGSQDSSPGQALATHKAKREDNHEAHQVVTKASQGPTEPTAEHSRIAPHIALLAYIVEESSKES